MASISEAEPSIDAQLAAWAQMVTQGIESQRTGDADTARILNDQSQVVDAVEKSISEPSDWPIGAFIISGPAEDLAVVAFQLRPDIFSVSFGPLAPPRPNDAATTRAIEEECTPNS